MKVSEFFVRKTQLLEKMLCHDLDEHSRACGGLEKSNNLLVSFSSEQHCFDFQAISTQSFRENCKRLKNFEKCVILKLYSLRQIDERKFQIYEYQVGTERYYLGEAPYD